MESPAQAYMPPPLHLPRTPNACEEALNLNKRQKEIFRKIERIIKSDEPVPTVADLGQMFGISQQAMSKNLKALEKLGMIRRNPNRHRSIELVAPPPRAARIQLLGRIAAGMPLEPVESEQTIDVPADLVPNGEVYALEVSGDSMIEDGIFDGDTVIIRRQSMAFDGQTVVAVLNGEATLKRYYHEGHRIRLQPANVALEPLYAGPDDEFEIRGIVYALYRKYKDVANQ